ncbi:hypothetical protein [Nocardioides sp. LML1-1-1.1]|uniref:hypothetical protein n=1 Tax=Nocardioides sp. LML1-1-1.1 TaxID=3135248 RepID=UPI00342EC175
MTIDEAVHDDLDTTTDTTTDTDAPRVEPPATPGAARDWRKIAAAVLVVLLALGAIGYLAVQLRAAHRDLDRYDAAKVAEAEVLESARGLAVALTTYDYRDLAAQQRQLEQGSTEAFLQKFAETNKTLGPMFTQLQASAKGTVVEIAVREVRGDLATVLAAVDQAATSKQSAQPTTQASRLRLHLVRQGDRWLLDSVDLL